jgi:hypothetical protein
MSDLFGRAAEAAASHAVPAVRFVLRGQVGGEVVVEAYEGGRRLELPRLLQHVKLEVSARGLPLVTLTYAALVVEVDADVNLKHVISAPPVHPQNPWALRTYPGTPKDEPNPLETLWRESCQGGDVVIPPDSLRSCNEQLANEYGIDWAAETKAFLEEQQFLRECQDRIMAGLGIPAAAVEDDDGADKSHVAQRLPDPLEEPLL